MVEVIMNSLGGDVKLEHTPGHGTSTPHHEENIDDPRFAEDDPRFAEIVEIFHNALAPHKERLLDAMKRHAQDKAELAEAEALIAKGLAGMAQAEIGMAEARAKILRGQAGMAAAEAKIESGQAKIESGQAKIERAQEGLVAAQEKIEIGEAQIDAGEQMIAESKRRLQNIICKRFFKIFNPKGELTAEQIDALSKKYLLDQSFSAEGEPGKSFIRINSTLLIIQYLTDNPTTKVCDLRSFKGEVNDLPALADFLKTSSLKLIAVNKAIPEAGKQKLAEAVAARNGGLKIQWA
jgi:hypothetical protein